MDKFDFERSFHVYEVVGEVIFRRSGNMVRSFCECKKVRTRAFVVDGEQHQPGDQYLPVEPSGTTAVCISVLVTGYYTYRFKRWFSDWAEEDNMGRASRDGNGYQSGRPIDIAVPVEAFDEMIETGRESAAQFVNPEYSDDQIGIPFQSPLAAVLIDGRWEEPIPRFQYPTRYIA